MMSIGRPPNGSRLSCGQTRPAAAAVDERYAMLGRAQTLRFLDPREARQLQALVRRLPPKPNCARHLQAMSNAAKAERPTYVHALICGEPHGVNGGQRNAGAAAWVRCGPVDDINAADPSPTDTNRQEGPRNRCSQSS